MSVWKDGKGRYHVAVQRGGNRVHRICPPEATWRDAKRKEAEILQRFDSVKSKKVLIADAIQHWLNTDVVHQKARESTTGNAYALAEWVVGRHLGDIVAVAKEYKNAHQGKLSNSTINRRLAVLCRVANLAYKRWEWIDTPIASRIELLPESPARERFLERPELAKLLRSIQNRPARRAVLVAAFTGLRRGELVKLRPVNVQKDVIYLPDTKNGRPRAVPLVHHIRFALKKLPFGVHADTLSHLVKKAIPDIRFHDLRRSCGSLLLQQGVDLGVISTLLGHSDISITKRIYAHYRLDDLRAAVAMLGKKRAA
jgi:integrase